jgi:hypothetical protein
VDLLHIEYLLSLIYKSSILYRYDGLSSIRLSTFLLPLWLLALGERKGKKRRVGGGY